MGPFCVAEEETIDLIFLRFTCSKKRTTQLQTTDNFQPFFKQKIVV